MHQLAVAYKSLRNLQSADTASAAVTGCETREWHIMHHPAEDVVDRDLMRQECESSLNLG
jgi:hypothetical protein